MISDNDVEEFLAHYGVKGQQWGVSNKNLSRSSRMYRAKDMATTEPKGLGQTIKDNPGKTVAIASGVVIGSLIAKRLIAKHSGVKISSINGIVLKAKL